jgi:hypothetical protein
MRVRISPVLDRFLVVYVIFNNITESSFNCDTGVRTTSLSSEGHDVCGQGILCDRRDCTSVLFLRSSAASLKNPNQQQKH